MTITQHYTELFSSSSYISILSVHVSICGFCNLDRVCGTRNSCGTRHKGTTVCNMTFLKNWDLFIFRYVLCTCMYAHSAHGCQKTVSDLTGAGVTDSCQSPWRSRESNPGALEEQPVLLTGEPFLQSPYSTIFMSSVHTPPAPARIQTGSWFPWVTNGFPTSGTVHTVQ